MSYHWQDICKCFSTSCFCNTNQVPTAHSNRNRLALNWKRLFEFLFLNKFNNWLRKTTLIPILNRFRTIDSSNFNLSICLPKLCNLFICHSLYLTTFNIQILSNLKITCRLIRSSSCWEQALLLSKFRFICLH